MYINKKRHTDEVIFEGKSLKGVDLCEASLCAVNLRGVNLSGTNLCGVDLHRTKGIHFIQTEMWDVTITLKGIQIGCKYYQYEEWKNFKKSDIDKMDKDAYTWWKKYKKIILGLYKTLEEG